MPGARTKLKLSLQRLLPLSWRDWPWVESTKLLALLQGLLARGWAGGGSVALLPFPETLSQTCFQDRRGKVVDLPLEAAAL